MVINLNMLQLFDMWNFESVILNSPACANFKHIVLTLHGDPKAETITWFSRTMVGDAEAMHCYYYRYKNDNLKL